MVLVSCVTYVILFQIFVVFGGETVNNTLANSFLDLLGKSNTFTGRTALWAVSDDMFLDSPIWGHGYISGNDYLTNVHFRGKGISPHNFIYSILHKGGILLFLVILSLIITSFKRIKRFLQTNDKIAFVIIITCITLFIMMLFEVYETIYLFFMLALMYYYPYISRSSNQ
jgi:O-antigen ligase